MKLTRLLTALALLSGFSILRADPPPTPDKDKAKSLFDGKTLDGWEGDAKLWCVKDGCLTGGNGTDSVKQNEFLATKTDYGNFILRLQIKLTGTEGFVNSGVQIRSQRVPNSSEMAGYQCDFGEGWWAKIYDESRRNKVMASPADEKTLNAAVKKNDWNDYVIRAEGGRIITWINGVQGVDYTEADQKIVQTGKIGIQVHGGGKTQVQVKDVTIEELPATPKAPEKKPE